MKPTLAALLLLLAPIAASAGEDDALPPPPEAGADGANAGATSPEPELAPKSEEGGYAKAAPAAYVPRYHTRSAWFFGFGLGTGDAAVASGRSFETIRDVVGAGAKVGAARAEIGLTLTDRLLFGVELGAQGTQGDVGGETARFVLADADAVLSFFPDADGLFVRFGGGVSWLHRERAGATTNDRGYNGLVGLGYAFWIGERFNLSLRIDHARAFFGKGSAADASEQWAASLGFDWF
jgi:hypothetical protein